jgi:hypothetical protein
MSGLISVLARTLSQEQTIIIISRIRQSWHRDQSNPALLILQDVGSRTFKLCFSTLSLLLLTLAIVHPNRALAKVTMVFPTHAKIEEYFSQESDAHQACIAFATFHGYSEGYCDNTSSPQMWWAGWLSEQKCCTTSPFYLGHFYYAIQCPVGQIPNRVRVSVNYRQKVMAAAAVASILIIRLMAAPATNGSTRLIWLAAHPV